MARNIASIVDLPFLYAHRVAVVMGFMIGVSLMLMMAARILYSIEECGGGSFRAHFYPRFLYICVRMPVIHFCGEAVLMRYLKNGEWTGPIFARFKYSGRYTISPDGSTISAMLYGPIDFVGGDIVRRYMVVFIVPRRGDTVIRSSPACCRMFVLVLFPHRVKCHPQGAPDGCMRQIGGNWNLMGAM